MVPLPADPYAALDIPRDATSAAIKTRYRKLVLRHHPDKVSDEGQQEEAGDKFYKIQAAYEILIDEDRRGRYDAQVKLAALRADAKERRGPGSVYDTRASDRAAPRYEERPPSHSARYFVRNLEEVTQKGRDRKYSSGIMNPLVVSTPSPQKAQTTSTPTYFELCVNRSSMVIRLGEITITDGLGNTAVGTDAQLFAEIRENYDQHRRRGLYNLFYRPSTIHYVHFGLQASTQNVGIYEGPDAIPPTIEVQEGRYLYHECPLTPLPPMPSQTFFQYYHGHTQNCTSKSDVFCNRLPKKLGSSMQTSSSGMDKLEYGWGVHIVEGPDKAVLAGLLAALTLLSCLVSIVYDAVAHEKESGFCN
ncbi:hypothetical protein TI39_contig594g00001, partial [Zymoseptoria brevis]